MKPRLLTVLIALWIATAVQAGDSQAIDWQKTLDQSEFSFNEREASFLYSFSQDQGHDPIRVTFDPAKRWSLTFEFCRKNSAPVSFQGHDRSVFCVQNDVLFFAEYSPVSDGCVIVATDLGTGKKIWETRLKGAGVCAHSAYRNEVSMSLSWDSTRKVVWITGHESFGDYMEVLDQSNGAELAYRLFRQGF